MKKIGLFSLCFASFVACENPELKEKQAKLNEMKCKTDFVLDLSANTSSTQALLISKGFENELTAFWKLQSDTLVSCDSLRNAWKTLSDRTQ
jgi:hypothetical protein